MTPEPSRSEAGRILGYAVPLTYGATLWLLVLRSLRGDAEAHAPAFALHWLRDASMTLPVVVLAVWGAVALVSKMADKSRPTLSVLARSCAAALGTSLALGFTAPLHDLLFVSARDAGGLGFILSTILLALPGALITACALTVALVRPPAREGANVQGAVGAEGVAGPSPVTSRRTFLKYGATGALTVGGTAGLVGMTSSGNAATATKINLFINDGEVEMVDGRPVYMWRFSKRERDANGDLLIPARPAVLRAVAGERIQISVRNNLDEPHSFVVREPRNLKGRPYRIDSGPIAPGKTWHATIRAPRSGTYLYEDGINSQVHRVLGLGGALVVLPSKRARQPFPRGPRFFGSPFVWVLQDIDPVWNELARQGRQNEITVPEDEFLPRYFNINGKGGPQAMEDETVHVSRHIGEPAWISIVNAGLATHALHWHGNHIFKWEVNGVPNLDALSEDDVVSMGPTERAGVLLPCHEAQDAWPPERGRELENCFPMHCHAEMSQTAAGGFYPGGMVTDWTLKPARQ